MNRDLIEIKRRNPVVRVAEMLGLRVAESGGRIRAICPFHDDRNPSCLLDTKADPADDHFHCFACGKHGDALDLAKHVWGCSFKEAACRLSGSTHQLDRIPTRQTKERKSESPQWSPPTKANLDAVSRLRGISCEALELAHDLGLLRFCIWKGQRAWAITDPRLSVASLRRTDGKKWNQIGGKKAWTWVAATGEARRMIGTTLLGDYGTVLVTEGGPDLLAGLQVLALHDLLADCGLVTLLGASVRPHDDDIDLLAGRKVAVVTHRDEAGEKLLQRVGESVSKVGARVIKIILDTGDLNDAVAMGRAGEVAETIRTIARS